MSKLASNQNIRHGGEGAARDAVFVVATDHMDNSVFGGGFFAIAIVRGKDGAGGIFSLVMFEAFSEWSEVARQPV